MNDNDLFTKSLFIVLNDDCDKTIDIRFINDFEGTIDFEFSSENEKFSLDISKEHLELIRDFLIYCLPKG